jgi:hypothetical protein
MTGFPCIQIWQFQQELRLTEITHPISGAGCRIIQYPAELFVICAILSTVPGGDLASTWVAKP